MVLSFHANEIKKNTACANGGYWSYCDAWRMPFILKCLIIKTLIPSRKGSTNVSDASFLGASLSNLNIVSRFGAKIFLISCIGISFL